MSKELDCPKCPFTPMGPIKEKGLVLDECPKCGGRWFDLGELGQTLKDPAKFQKALAQGPLKPREGKAICPHCHKNMVNGGLLSEFLRADLCPGCRGMWLDKNELGLVERLLAAL